MTEGPRPAVVLRADGGPSIGMGHVVRCAAIAEALAGSRIEVHALCDDVGVSAVSDPLSAAGAAVQRIETASLADDANATIAACRNAGARAAIIDLAKINTHPSEGIAAGVRYLERLRDAGVRALLVDDLALLPRCPAAAILNPNLGAETMSYRGIEPGACLLLGARYAPVRSRFRELRETLPPAAGRARGVLVMLGGGGGGHLLVSVLEAIAGVAPGLAITAVVGPSATSSARIAEAAERVGASLRAAPEEIAELLAAADIAVTGGGTTKYELAVLGIPAVLIPMVDHQAPLTAAFAREGIAADLGPGLFDANAFRRAFEPLVADAGERMRMRARGRTAVDGLGAERVAAAVREELLEG